MHEGPAVEMQVKYLNAFSFKKVSWFLKKVSAVEGFLLVLLIKRFAEIYTDWEINNLQLH